MLFIREPGLQATVNQTVPASDFAFGGRQWESLGTVLVSDDPAVPGLPGVEVLIKQATAGIVAADAVMLRKVEPVLPALRLVTLTENPLDNRSRMTLYSTASVWCRRRRLDLAPVIPQIPPQSGTNGAVDFDSTNDFSEIPHDNAIVRQLTPKAGFSRCF